MLNKDLELTLSSLINDAMLARHEFITLEYLLLVLMDNVEVEDIFYCFNIDIEKLRTQLIEYVEGNIPKVSGTNNYEPQPTVGFHRTLQRAVFQAQSSEKEEVDGEGLFVALLSETESSACFFLRQQGISRFEVIGHLTFNNLATNEDDISDLFDEENEETDAPVTAFLTNLNDRALANKIDPLIGRKYEVERVIQTLCRRRKNNPLLVGEAGVGKTAIAEGLANKIIGKDVPEVLHDHTVYSLDLGSLMAGTKYRGDFEKRLEQVFAKLEEDTKNILFIDEIHTIIGAGATSNGTMDVANIIKPKLANGELHCIGATTFKEYRSIFKKDHALTRRFQKIDVLEPSIEDTIEILGGLKSRFEKYHDVKYSNLAIKTAVELSNKHINDRKLPDKAIDVIDETGAYNRLLKDGQRLQKIGVSEIEATVAKIARIPEKQISNSDKTVLKNIEKNIKLVVFGQDKAIEQLATVIKLARSGLSIDNKPIGSFLFAGPTGVGKTEVSKQLAIQLGVELLRFDMSEYMERHSVSRLIGAPPGYVGYDQGGLLTDAVSKNPHAVLLLDEIEKAHSDLFSLLLQVMDNGTLTDASGDKVDFRNVILIMTTNAGAESINRSSIGFTKQDNSRDGQDIIKKLFTPEFRNRLDDVVNFDNLNAEHIAHVVDKFITELQSQLDGNQIEIHVNEPAKKWLASNGYEANMGARPMRRLIQAQIRKPLANEILFGKLQHGGRVMVGLKSNQLTIKAIARVAKTKQLIQSSE